MSRVANSSHLCPADRFPLPIFFAAPQDIALHCTTSAIPTNVEIIASIIVSAELRISHQCRVADFVLVRSHAIRVSAELRNSRQCGVAQFASLRSREIASVLSRAVRVSAESAIRASAERGIRVSADFASALRT